MRMTALLALGLAATPLAAQTATVPDPPASAPASSDVVGPRDLQNFNLGGTVIRPAPPTAPAPSRQRPSPTPSATGEPTVAVPLEAARTAPVRPAVGRHADSRPAPAPSLASPLAPSPPGGIDAVPAPAAPADVAAAAPTSASPASGETPLWPWLLALLAAVGAAAFVYLRRQQGDEDLAFAGAGLSETVPVAPPRPLPSPRAAPAPPPRPAPSPVPAPAPPPIPGGIVSQRLRPEIELVFTPLSVAVDDAGTAMVVFELIVHNMGGAPARDVLVEAGMFNAGPQQDELIGKFFANPLAQGDRIPMIAPMSHIGVRSRVSIPADRLDAVEIEGRKLLVPLVAFNMLYRWSGGETQRSASFLIGRGDNDAPKLAPFSLDRGSRAWGDVAARSHSNGLASHDFAS